MSTITLKNFPEALLKKLKERAIVHKRSLSEEAIVCLTETLQMTEEVPAHLWEERFQKIGRIIQAPQLTDDFLDWAVSHGRE